MCTFNPSAANYSTICVITRPHYLFMVMTHYSRAPAGLASNFGKTCPSFWCLLLPYQHLTRTWEESIKRPQCSGSLLQAVRLSGGTAQETEAAASGKKREAVGWKNGYWLYWWPVWMRHGRWQEMDDSRWHGCWQVMDDSRWHWWGMRHSLQDVNVNCRCEFLSMIHVKMCWALDNGHEC